MISRSQKWIRNYFLGSINLLTSWRAFSYKGKWIMYRTDLMWGQKDAESESQVGGGWALSRCDSREGPQPPVFSRWTHWVLLVPVTTTGLRTWTFKEWMCTEFQYCGRRDWMIAQWGFVDEGTFEWTLRVSRGGVSVCCEQRSKWLGMSGKGRRCPFLGVQGLWT